MFFLVFAATLEEAPECPSPTGVAKLVKAQAAGILLGEKKASEIHVQNVCVSIYSINPEYDMSII